MSSRKNREACLKRFQHNVLNYTLNYSLLIVSYSIIWTGLALAISSLEKRYSLSGSQSGFIFSAAECGRIPTILLISYFGKRFSIPKLMASAGVCVALSQMIVFLPHFVFSPGSTESFYVFHSHEYCDVNSTLGISSSNNSKSTIPSNHVGAYSMIVVGMVLMGISASPLSNLALAYIDDNAKEGDSPFYLGLVNAAWSVGPIIGSFLGAYFLSLYVDLTVDSPLTPSDPAWVGAWWVVVVLSCATTFASSPFLACYPRKIQNGALEHGALRLSDKPACDDTTHLLGCQSFEIVHSLRVHESVRLQSRTDNENEDLGDKEIIQLKEEYTLRGFFRTLVRLITNPLFSTLTIYAIIKDLFGFGYRTVSPKYMEFQFGVTSWNSSLIVGMANVSTIFANVASGTIVKKFKLSYVSTLRLVVVASVLTLVCNIALMFVGCSNSRLAGKLSSGGTELSLLQCSQRCSCDLEVYTPYCDTSQQTTYFTPCHAGCISPANRTFTNNTLCSCVATPLLKAGSCDSCEPYAIPVFITLMYLENFVFFFGYTPHMSVLLRSVNSQDKSPAMGLCVFAIALLGWLPCTLLYGKIADTTCLVWQVISGSSGTCWIYNRKQFRLAMFGANSGLCVASIAVIVASWYIARKRKITWTSQDKTH